MKPKTIDEVCNQPAGSFKKFVTEKKGFLQKLEKDRKNRIRSTREASQQLSWAA